MTITIEWDPKEEMVYISEENATEETYHVEGSWPGVIGDICACLDDYMTCMDTPATKEEDDHE